MSFEYVKNHYGVPACVGRKVMAYGKPGVIAEDLGHHIGILLDEDKPGNVNPYHPVDGIVYLGMGKVRKITRSQKRYQLFLEVGDMYDDFEHFLKCGA